MTGWLAAVLVMLIVVVLVVVEFADTGARRWWAAHPLTTDVVAGLLVLLVTVLVVNQLLSRRQAGQRGYAVAVQAAIVVAQAARSAGAVSSVLGGSGEGGAASDGLRTYMIMLVVTAPLLIEDPVARRLLEQAQYLGGVMARVLAGAGRSADGAAARGDLDDAVEQVRVAAAPLLALLSPAVRDSVQGIGRTAAG